MAPKRQICARNGGRFHTSSDIPCTEAFSSLVRVAGVTVACVRAKGLEAVRGSHRCAQRDDAAGFRSVIANLFEQRTFSNSHGTN
jgi:hypothetical protein